VFEGNAHAVQLGVVHILKTKDVIAALGTGNEGKPAAAADLFLREENF
jgi:hypothetical protein